jgi:hypothetical protein
MPSPSRILGLVNERVHPDNLPQPNVLLIGGALLTPNNYYTTVINRISRLVNYTEQDTHGLHHVEQLALKETLV